MCDGLVPAEGAGLPRPQRDELLSLHVRLLLRRLPALQGGLLRSVW
jgi:hypothetical protein